MDTVDPWPVVSEELTRELETLTQLSAHPERLQDTLSHALVALRDVIPYDLAALYQLDGDTLHVRAAEGPLASPDVRSHSLQLSRFPTMRRALRSRRPIPLDEHDHVSDEGDPYDGLLDLPPGHSCMVVPLQVGARDLGIITLDRAQCGPYDTTALRITALYAQLVSLALVFAEQAAQLDRYRHQLKEQNRLLEDELSDGLEAVRALEASGAPAMQQLVRMARAAAGSDVPILVQGETGSGKEVLARAIHAWSPRASGPFVKLNCAAIPENLVESELFGHVRGAFSGAVTARDGRFLTADGGTLLLDEIGDMPLEQQAKLLRVLQEGSFTPVGSDREVHVDVRVLVASHVDLTEAVHAGRFREDLYFRIAVFPLSMPPLRERPDDIVPLARHWLTRRAQRSTRGPWRLTKSAADALVAHSWGGNVRQLVNVLERATILVPEGAIDTQDLGLGPSPLPVPCPDRALPTFEANERAYLEALMARAGGKVYGDDGAAALAGLKPTTLQSKLKRVGLK